MSFLRGLAGTPHLGDKAVGNCSDSYLLGVEIPTKTLFFWDTGWLTPLFSTARPEREKGLHLAKWQVIHNLRLAITTNIYK